MRKTAIIPAWGRILRGFRPFLSIEITKECPLKCPGCYAYEPGHLNDGRHIRALREWRGEELVERVLGLVRRFRPLHVSIVGGEPLIRYRELTCLIREFNTMGIEVQVVTSAFRRSPPSGRNSPICTSSFPSTAFSPNTTRAGLRRRMIASSDTLMVIGSPFTARSSRSF